MSPGGGAESSETEAEAPLELLADDDVFTGLEVRGGACATLLSRPPRRPQNLRRKFA